MGILCPGEAIHQIGQQRARAGEEDVKGFHIRYVLHIVTRVRASFHRPRAADTALWSVQYTISKEILPEKNIENAVKSFPPPVHPYFSFVKGALFFPNSPQSPKILNEICYFHRKACPVLVDFGGDSCIMIDRRIRIRISSSAARPPFG